MSLFDDCDYLFLYNTVDIPAETMTMSRPSYFVDINNPGTEPAAEAAAAMAAGYLVSLPCLPFLVSLCAPIIIS